MVKDFSPWPEFSDEEGEAVRRVLMSNKVNYWTGAQCREFENRFADYVGAHRAIALANGTLALELALRGLGIGPGDEVVVTPRSFIASASCVISVGAKPVFADVDPCSQNLTADTIGQVLTPATRAVICVHLAGWPCEMDEIMALAEEKGLYVVEDCAQAHGASYHGRRVGSLGHVAAWSFCQDKIMTTGGEGGMVTTDDLALWSRMWSYKDHGKSWEAVYERDHPEGFRWVHDSFGSNWRMIEMQAAIGLIQIDHLDDWVASRQANAKRLDGVCQRHPVQAPSPPAHIGHAYYRFNACVDTGSLANGWTRDRIVREINLAGVPCMHGSCAEIYREKAFVNAGIGPARRLPNARALGEASLCFLVHPTITPQEMDMACHVVDRVLTEACIAKAT